jgi:hypothetical protein
MVAAMAEVSMPAPEEVLLISELGVQRYLTGLLLPVQAAVPGM